MTMQIRAIAIYSLDGERRDVRFALGRLNIVAGGSKTGKSALLDIVDYCWGRSECTVAQGEIRRSVSWFAVLFDRDGEGILVARRNPGPAAATSDDIHFERNAEDLPERDDGFTKNITADGLRLQLSILLGIPENLQVPEPGATRQPLAATSGQAIFFCLQAQDEIANRRLLFHRQGDQYIPQHIKDVLPYFVGAVDEDHYLNQRRLADARTRLRRLERDLADAEAAAGESSGAADRLLGEARRAGLIEFGETPADPTAVRQLLEVASAPRSATLAEFEESGTDLAELEENRRRLRVEMDGIREEIDEVKRFSKEAAGFETEAKEHEARLVSIGLVGATDADHGSCPLCASRLTVAVPSVEEIRRSLTVVERQLASVRRDSPRLQTRLADLETRRSTKEREIREAQARIAGRIAENERLRVQQDRLAEGARVAGRIAYFLENARTVSVGSQLREDVTRCRAQVSELQRLVDPEVTEERLAGSLSLIASYLAEYARHLDLEHSDHPLRFDRRNLTVVAESPEGPLPLGQMGSGENWVGYHVALHLALHRLLRLRRRPVPAFLILDQPSQAHYPPERDVGQVGGQDDEDQIAVARLFRLLWDYARELAPTMQVIVMDHFEVLDDWFRDATVERWRDGIKLVPLTWVR
ncbi:DUF3732 domain-containing protein [Roseomonas sp. CECT 9278]|jgi:hypothetical protein|uniref:DUF3732 domain-containing protein n=1 Tax=Roseomonas sp. CECT 9278 TaxID=2845823 RepID=UPI001E46772E|nr:DUF3732 domain-containing protein [Roseomonas sp. CECT 9278]CAH0178693.1 hypothetical protein ROS9278_01385 [Roseomonas sp. CECT 9278]